MDEHCPPQLALVFQALGHTARLASQTPLAGLDDGDLVRRLDEVECNWLVGMDLHREPEVWISVLSALAENQGRILRIRPWRKQVSGADQVAWLSRFVVDGYDEWSRWLSRRSVRMIDVGRAWKEREGGGRKAVHGFTVHAAHTAVEVGRLLQGELTGDGRELFPSKRPSRSLVTRRGRREPRTSADRPPPNAQ